MNNNTPIYTPIPASELQELSAGTRGRMTATQIPSEQEVLNFIPLEIVGGSNLPSREAGIDAFASQQTPAKPIIDPSKGRG